MDKRFLASIFVIGLLSGSIITVSYYKIAGTAIQVYFSPNGGCEQVILYYIQRAESSIHILTLSA